MTNVGSTEIVQQSDSEKWNRYWQNARKNDHLYAKIANLYRRFLISPSLGIYFRNMFRNHSNVTYLHAGCGSAGSDRRIVYDKPLIVLFDLSVEGLKLARRHGVHQRSAYVCGDLLHLPFKDAAFDGAWNLGVIEHFEAKSIRVIFAQLNRVLKLKGRCLLLWPPIFGSSVLFLKCVSWLSKILLHRSKEFYPDEVSLYRSRAQVNGYIENTDFKLSSVRFNVSDAWTQVAVVITKQTR